VKAFSWRRVLRIRHRIIFSEAVKPQHLLRYLLILVSSKVFGEYGVKWFEEALSMYIASEPVVRKHLVHELLYHTGKSADDVLIT